MVTLSRDFDFSLGNEVDEYYRPKGSFGNSEKKMNRLFRKSRQLHIWKAGEYPRRLPRSMK